MRDTHVVPDRWQLEIALLGAWSARAAGQAFALPTKKAQALVAYLALRAGRTHEREVLRGLLWPEFPKAQAQASLRQALSAIRRALPATLRPALRVTSTTIALDPALTSVDVVTAEQYLTDPTLASLERAAGLMSGPLLEGFATGEAAFDEWLEAERARLNHVMLDALERLAELQASARRTQCATQTALHALRLEPLQERTHRLVMRLYALQGRRAEALQHYERCVALLNRELGVEPDEETTRLYRELQRVPVSLVRSSGALAVTQAAPFVGRAAELAWLEQAAASAQAERGLFLVCGDAGVGKTRLLEAFCGRLVGAGSRCLRGRCFESEQVLPFALWVDLLRSARAALDAATLAALPPAYRSELARILPDCDLAAERTPARADARTLFEAFSALLVLWAAASPLLVVLEDLHWADGMSLRLLSFLIRRLPAAAHVTAIASVRAEEIRGAPDLRQLLRELRREQRLSELALEPLGCVETRELVNALSGPHSEHALERIWALSEGNPLVVVACVRDVEGGPRAQPSAALAVPERVQALVLDHTESLAPSARAALAAAAVIGREFDLELLREACGADASELALLCEELVERRLLRSSSGGLDFAHDRIREVLYASLLPARRALLHGSVARALERCSAEQLDQLAGTIGYHYAHAARPEESIAFLLRFAERCARSYGLEQALAALTEAERQCAALPALHRDARSLEVAILRCSCLLNLGRVLLVEPTLAPLREAVERLEQPALSGPFHTWTAFAKSFLGDGAAAVEHGTRALAEAERCGDLRTAGLAHSLLVLEASVSAHFLRGIGHGRQAVSLLQPAHSDPEVAAFAHLHLGFNYLNLGDWQPAHEVFVRAGEIAERSDNRRLQCLSLATIGATRLCTGDFAASVLACRQALELAPDPHSAWLSQTLMVRVCSFTASLRADASVLREEPCASALRALELSLSAAGSPTMRGFTGRAMAVLADAYIMQEDTVRARQLLASAFASPLLAGDPFGRAAAIATQARLELALGDLEQAAGHIDQAGQRFEAVGARFDWAITRLIAANVALAQDAAAAAAHALAAARQAFCELKLPRWTELLDDGSLPRALYPRSRL